LTFFRHNSSSSTSSSSPLSFTATTNSDGRVTSWTPSNSQPFTQPQPLETVFHEQGDQKYSLTFNTEEYFGARDVKTFFPEVEVKFVVRQEQKGEHFHVPVLLGPFGYTTYRGS
jgi:5-hydroxyisourate hydrolase